MTETPRDPLRACGDCRHDWSAHLDWPGACDECVCQAFLRRDQPAPTADEDAAWEALAQDVGFADPYGESPEAAIARHRPLITAAIRRAPSPDGLDATLLTKALAYGIDRQLGPGSAIEFTAAIGSAVAEYARLRGQQ
jgi:hypothetical protein